jgi:hypothetical protein
MMNAIKLYRHGVALFPYAKNKNNKGIISSNSFGFLKTLKLNRSKWIVRQKEDSCIGTSTWMSIMTTIKQQQQQQGRFFSSSTSWMNQGDVVTKLHDSNHIIHHRHDDASPKTLQDLEKVRFKFVGCLSLS